MSCEVCQLHSGKFRSELEYMKVRKRVAALIAKGELDELGEIDPTSSFCRIKYQCKVCGQLRVLEVPDQAFRGVWNKLSNKSK